MLPIDQIRSQFPALNRKHLGMQAIYLDGPGGTQVVNDVIESMVSYLSNGTANRHGEFPTSYETEEHIEKARNAAADFLNVNPKGIAFGQNATSLMFSVSRALGKTWNSKDNIVVSEIDHCSNVDSWRTAAQDSHTDVRFIPVDTKTLSLNVSELNTIIDEHTKLVSVTLASNAVGTITDIKKIAQRAHEVGALLSVDAVHAAPHFYIDCEQIDILFCSAYKFFGTHIGIAMIKEKSFEQLPAYKVSPAPNHYPDKLETGTQNFESIASIESVINFIAGLGTGVNRNEKIKNAFIRIEEHEDKLANKLRHSLSEIPEVTLYQSPDRVEKTPTIAFTIDGTNPAEVCKWLSENYAIFVANGDFYASILADKLGINENGGWIRAGISIYNTESEIEFFIESIQSYIKSIKVNN